MMTQIRIAQNAMLPITTQSDSEFTVARYESKVQNFKIIHLTAINCQFNSQLN